MKMVQKYRRSSSIQRDAVKRESEEFRRTVVEIVAEEIKKMRREDEREVESVRRKFVENVSLVGLTEAIKSKHRIVKALWLIIFLAGLGATGYFLYRIADEYRRHPTATKVVMSRRPVYVFPPVVLCLDTWLNAEKAIDKMGFTKDAIAYALRYLTLFEDVGAGEIPPPAGGRQSPKAREEFYEAYSRNNYTNLVEFFKDIAVDMTPESRSSNQSSADAVYFFCNGCAEDDVAGEHLEKVVMNTGVCHRIVLKPVDGKLRQSSGLPELRLRVPDLSRGLVGDKAYWKLYIKPLVRQLVASSTYISIYEGYSHAVKISSRRFDMVNKPGEPCIRNADPTARYDRRSSNGSSDDVYSSLSCSLLCVCQSMTRLYGCTVLNLDDNFTSPLTEYCNTYYWSKWPDNHPADWIEDELNRRQRCVEACPHECSLIMYDTQIDMHPSKELTRVQEEWNRNNSNKVPLKSAKIYFINSAVLSGGVLTFEEVYTYSFETLVGNIGGTCGIWIGVSIMTLIQLFMFFLEQSLRKGAKTRLKFYQTYKTDQKAAETQSTLV